MTSITETDVFEALSDIYDPEIPMINIVDLGLIYDVKINEGDVQVTMSLTAQGCPMSGTIGGVCTEAVEAIAGVNSAMVDIVWDPPWTPDMITEDGKKALGWE